MVVWLYLLIPYKSVCVKGNDGCLLCIHTPINQYICVKGNDCCLALITSTRSDKYVIYVKERAIIDLLISIKGEGVFWVLISDPLLLQGLIARI